MQIKGVRKVFDTGVWVKSKDMRGKLRERERERERKRVYTYTIVSNQKTRVQSIIKEKSHKFQQRLFIRSCPNFNIVFVY